MPNQHRQQNPLGQSKQKNKKRKKSKKGLSLTKKEEEEERERRLRHLQDIFHDILDAVLIHSILEEHNFEVAKALETLLPLAEQAEKSTNKKRGGISSFKDIKDRLERENVSGGDGTDSDESSLVDEENTLNELRDSSLDLPLLPSSSLRDQTQQRNDSPSTTTTTMDDSHQRRPFQKSSYSATSSDIDKLLAQQRNSTNPSDTSLDLNTSPRDEVPQYLNGYYGNKQQGMQPGQNRTEKGQTLYAGDRQPFYGMQYTNSDVNSPQGTQDYLSTYYDTRSVTQGYYNPEHRQRTTYADLNIGVHQRTAPYNSYSRTLPSHGKENAPSWPKKQSQIVRTEKPKPQNLERHVEPLPRGKVLCLLRGLPGSGKTTLARELLNSARTGVIISTDDFFMKRDGTYEFNSYKLEEAHQSTQRKAKRAMEKGITPVIIDNTNTQLWEMQPYVAMAVTMNYHVEVREPRTPWREKVGELARRNTHGVPFDKIGRMLQRFERLDSLATLLQSTHSAGKKRTEPHHEHELGEGNANYKSPQRMTSNTKQAPVSVRRVTKDQAVGKASDKQHPGHTTHTGSDKALPRTGIVKETVFAEKEDSQCTNVPLEGTQRSGSNGMDDCLSEQQDVITSIPLASCLNENIASFQNKVSAMKNIDEIWKSSGSDDILPVGRQHELDKGDKNENERNEKFPGQSHAAENNHTNMNHAKDKVNNTKQNVKDTRRTKGTPAAVNPETEEGNRVKRLISSSLHSTNTTPGNNSKHLQQGSTGNKSKDQSRLLPKTGDHLPGGPEFAKYLTASEQDNESVQVHGPTDSSEGKKKESLSMEKERLLGSVSSSDVSVMSKISKSPSTLADVSSNRPSGIQKGKVRKGDSTIEGRLGASGPTAAYRAQDGTVDDGNTSSGNTECFQSLGYLPAKFSSKTDTHGVPGINVDHRSTTTTVVGNNQPQTLGSEWEEAGARPKVKRTISEPVVPYASEDPGTLVNSPIRASDMQFRSLETVPRTKKRIRRAGTPLPRRSLAPTFSAPELPTLSESLPSNGEVAGDDKDNDACISPLLSGHYKSVTGVSAYMESVHEGSECKTNVAHPSDKPRESTSAQAEGPVTEGVRKRPGHEQDGVTRPSQFDQDYKNKTQPIKRTVARASKQTSPPLINEETRQKAMNLNWSSGAIKKEVLSPQEAVMTHKSLKSIPEMTHQSSQTDPSHFRILERVTSAHGSESPVPGHFWIKTTSSKLWVGADASVCKAEGKETIPHRRKIDKSSMTEEVHFDFRMLHTFFPHLEKQQIKSVVQDCHGDVQLASEVLIELSNETDYGLDEDKIKKGRRRGMTRSTPGNELPTRFPKEEKSSQTSRADLLVLKVINDGAKIDEEDPNVDVLVSKRWISSPVRAALNGDDGRFIEAETMTSSGDEPMPEFDQHLAQLLQTYPDIPYAEVCELLERNGDDFDRTDWELKKMKAEVKKISAHAHLSEDITPNGRKHLKSSSPTPSARSKQEAARDGTGLSEPASKANRLKNVVSTGVDRRNEQGKKPSVVKKKTTSNRLSEEESASFSDQDGSHHQRGRRSQSTEGQSQGGTHHRRSRSLPRNKSPSPRRDEKIAKDEKLKQKPAAKTTHQPKSDNQQKVQNAVSGDKHPRKESQSKDGTNPSKQPGRGVLGKHLGAREEEMRLPNRYNFQDLKRKQKMEESSQVDVGDLTDLEMNGQERNETEEENRGEAASLVTSRATPSDLLDEEGKGVPARFHEGMTFQLDMAFALQLQEIFGSVGYNIDSDVLSEDDLTISVNLQLAKAIHFAWRQNFQQKFEREEKQLLGMMKQDEELAKQLQQEEQMRMKAVQKQLEKETLRKTSSRADLGSPSLSSRSPGVRTETFRDIMDDDMAEELGRKMQMEDAMSSGVADSMAVTIKRKELSEKYPGVESSWLENIFMSFDYNFETTVIAIDSIINGTNEQPQQAMQWRREESAQYTVQENEDFQVVMNRRKTESRPQHPQDEYDNDDEDDDDDDDDNDDLKKPEKFQSINHPDYHDYRAEANQHYQRRQECFKKASEAFRKGQTEQAAYYSQQGHKHTALLQEANERASEAILVDRNKGRDESTIDLHGLHANEAIQVLQRTIEEKTNTIKYSSPYLRPSTHLFIITGRGNNSKGGVARVKPAVQRYLKSKGFKFTKMNDGMFRIKLG